MKAKEPKGLSWPCPHPVLDFAWLGEVGCWCPSLFRPVVILPTGTLGNVWGHFDYQNWEGWWGAGGDCYWHLKSLQCTGQFSTTWTYRAGNVHCAKFGKPCLTWLCSVTTYPKLKWPPIIIIVLPFMILWVDWAQLRIPPLYVMLAKISGTRDSLGSPNADMLTRRLDSAGALWWLGLFLLKSQGFHLSTALCGPSLRGSAHYSLGCLFSK